MCLEKNRTNIFLVTAAKDGKADDYYVMSQDGVKLTGCIPMIAVMKNGYPILKEHEHESEAYIAYNHLNQSLEEHGIATEVGVVKNHNGAFEYEYIMGQERYYFPEIFTNDSLKSNLMSGSKIGDDTKKALGKSEKIAVEPMKQLRGKCNVYVNYSIIEIIYSKILTNKTK